MQQFLETPLDDKVRIVVDQREDNYFVDLLKKEGAEVDYRTLEVGDFLCSARLVIERKTRSDFEQSVIDGRLFSQLPNLISNYERVVIIIEGTTDEGRLSRSSLLGTYATIVSDFGASIIYTKNKEATAEIVFNFAKHEQIAKKNPLRIYARKKVFTPSQMARAVIESFPSIGPKLAKSILSHFGTLEKVFLASEQDLSLVSGLGRKRAKIIRSVLNHTYDLDSDKSNY